MIDKKIKQLFKNEFVKNFFTLLTGSAGAQFILFAVMPILTRIYSREVFGVFFAYSSLSMILSIAVTLRYELSIVLPKKNKDANELVILTIIIAIINSLLGFLFIAFFFDFIVQQVGEKGQILGKWLYFIPLSTLATGVFQAFNYLNNRHKSYKIISAGKLTKSLVTAILQVGSGILKFVKTGLISGLICGQLFAAAYIAVTSIRKKKLQRRKIRFSELKKIALKYKDIPAYNTIISVLNTLSNQLPVLLLISYFGLAEAGIYGLANRVIQTPMGLISQSVGQVFYQKASEKYNDKQNMYLIVKKAFRDLFKVAVIPFILLFCSTLLFSYLFGQEWEMAGKVARFLVPWLFVGFLNSPITYIITVLKRQKQIVFYESFLLIARYLSLYLGYKYYHSFVWSVGLYAFSGFIFNLFLLFYLQAIAKKSAFNEYE